MPEGAVGRGDGMMVLKNGCYGGVVLVNSLHPEYEAHQDWWRTQREVMAGDRAVIAFLQGRRCIDTPRVKLALN